MEKINTLWHFGDSFGCWKRHNNDRSAKKGYSEYIANEYNLIFSHHAVEGECSEQTFNRILKQFSKFKSGDFIIINWSFFNRISFLNKEFQNRTTNTFVTYPGFNGPDTIFEFPHEQPYSKDYCKYVLESKLNFSTIESMGMFINLIFPFLISLKEMGCTIINSFNSDIVDISSIEPSEFFIPNTDKVNLEKLVPDELPFINWGYDNQYLGFLENNNFSKEDEDVHYRYGIQNELANHWISKINSQILTKL